MMNPSLFIFTIICFLLSGSVQTYAQSPIWQWANSFGSESHEFGSSIANDELGNIYVTGSFGSASISFGNTTLVNSSLISNFYDVFTVKYDAKGTVIWSRSAVGNDVEQGQDITVDKSGNVYVTGYFVSFGLTFGNITVINTDSVSMFLVKYDPEGNALWAAAAPTNSREFRFGVTTDNAGNVFVSSQFKTPSIRFGTHTVTNAGLMDVFIVKYSPDGEALWAKSIGGSNDESVGDIATDSEGYLYSTGSFRSTSIPLGTATLQNTTSNGFMDLFVVKYAPNGDIRWATSPSGNSFDVGNAIAIDTNGNVFIAGMFGDADITFGNIVLTNGSANDICIAKYSPDGSVMWARGFGGGLNDHGKKITTDASGNIYLAGDFESKYLKFGDSVLSSDLGGDIFVAKFTNDGALLWVDASKGSGFEQVNGIIADNFGSAYVTGGFHSYPFRLGSFQLISYPNLYDIFVAKVSDSPTSITEETTTSSIQIFPNPAIGKFHVKGMEGQGLRIIITSLDGKPITTTALDTINSTIDLSGRAKGTYIYQLQKDNEIVKTGKLILE